MRDTTVWVRYLGLPSLGSQILTCVEGLFILAIHAPICSGLMEMQKSSFHVFIKSTSSSRIECRLSGHSMFATITTCLAYLSSIRDERSRPMEPASGISALSLHNRD